MKKILLFIAKMLVVSLLAAQSIPDPGFEIWNTSIWPAPKYYTTSNLLFTNTLSSGYPANVTQTTGKYGSYGIQIASIRYGNDTLPGLLIDANVGNGNGPTGGIPYDQKPTGMRFWYKYTSTGKDTAAVLAMFKLNGTLIDSFLILIPSSASTSTYTLHSYFATHLLSATPDTLIFGALSSKALMNSSQQFSKGIIPGSTLVIDSVTFTGVGSNQPAKLNGNFENWIADTINIPVGWHISYPGTTLTKDHHAGSYALQVATVNTSTSGPQSGMASTGYYPNNCQNNCNEQGGFPFTKEIDTLGFWYKYSPKPNDTASININFKKNGNSIYGTGFSVYTSATSWTYAHIPFNLGQTPDTVIIDINASSHNNLHNGAQYLPYVGSVFKIDNLSFASQPLGMAGIKEQFRGIKVYPNPARIQINVDLTNIPGSLERIAIYDMSGRMLSSQNYSGWARTDIQTIDVGGLSNGLYMLEVITNNGVFYQKIGKE